MSKAQPRIDRATCRDSGPLWKFTKGNREVVDGWRCASCRHDLRGCTESLCPQCGTAFSEQRPIDTRSHSTSRVVLAVLLIALNALSFLCFVSTIFMFADDSPGFLPIGTFVMAFLILILGALALFSVGVGDALRRRGNRSWIITAGMILPCAWVVLAVGFLS